MPRCWPPRSATICWRGWIRRRRAIGARIWATLWQIMPCLRDARRWATSCAGHAALRRRLAQVGVVDADQAERLQPDLRQGQRLVSRDGGLWRWDGFVRRPDAGRAAAARLQQRARLFELRRDAARARAGLLDAERALAAAQAAADAARAGQRRCRERP